MDVFTSVFGGFATFSVLGHLTARLRVAVPDVVQSGPSLVFTVCAEVLGLLPLAPLWALVRFNMFVLYFVPLYHYAYIMYTRCLTSLLVKTYEYSTGTPVHNCIRSHS